MVSKDTKEHEGEQTGHKSNFPNLAENIGGHIGLRHMPIDMAKSTEGKTVKIRLSAEQLERLETYADRMGFNGLSTVLRALAFENLSLKEAQHQDDIQRKVAADKLLRQQLGGGKA